MSDGVFSISPSRAALPTVRGRVPTKSSTYGERYRNSPASDTVKWKFKTEGPFPEESPAISITSSPAIGADGTVYVGSGIPTFMR